MEELIVTLSKIISQLHVQDTRTLELLTQLIQSVSRIEDRVTVLETGIREAASDVVTLEHANAELCNKVYNLQTQVDSLLDDSSERIQ